MFRLPADPRAFVREEGKRVADLGQWPPYATVEDRLAARLPRFEREEEGREVASGFDAGMACVFGLIPEDKQRLSAELHVQYSPVAVAQVLQELEDLDADSETCWWLAACSVCDEDGVDWAGFTAQCLEMHGLFQNPQARLAAAQVMWKKMQTSFHLVDGVAFATVDGGMQAAYAAGHKLAVWWSEKAGIFFVGTFHPSLGLEDFAWGTELDEDGRTMSGMISPQFVKCNGFEELGSAVSVARKHLGV